MHKFDIHELSQKLKPKQSYRLSDVKDKIEKVAFDVVKFKDGDDIGQLWKIHDTNDGPVIVALYDEVTKTAASNSDWKTISDGKANIHVFYKGEPVKKFAASQYGLGDEVADWMADKLSSDSSFRKAFLKTLGSEDSKLLIAKYPELGQEDK